MSMCQVNWQWINSATPLRICAALAWNNVRLPLLSYLRNHVDENGYKQLQIISNRNVIVLIGEQDQLPWIDGIRYAGYDNNEPRLWRPAQKEPSVPMSLLADSLCQYYQQTTLLIWNEPQVIIPINKAQFVDKRLLNLITAQCDKSI